MKKLTSVVLLISVMIFNSILLFSNNETIDLNDSNQTKLELVISTPEKLGFESVFGKVKSMAVKTENGEFIQLSIERCGKSNNEGYPELPVMHRLIEMPYGANPEVEIIDYTIVEYNLKSNNPLIPMQMSQPKCGSSKSFAQNQEVYSKNEFYSETLVSVEKLGMLRGANIGRLNISPVSYNPVTNTIKVVTNIKFEVTFNNADLLMTKEIKANTRSPFFDGVYNQLLNNQYNNTRDWITSYPVHYLIISDPMFENQLKTFIDWKKRKGFTVTEAYTDEIGSSLQQIKDYIQNLYNNGTPENPAPSFVLFVGDVAQIPAWDNGNGATDRNYVEYTGDLFPEIFYGRFSAENADHLQPYLDKTLMYEQYTMPNPSYLDTVLMVSGVDASYAHDWGNGQINYGTINYFNEDHDIFSHTYLYPASSSASAALQQNVSEGITFGNYTAHCSPNGWADPSFSISDIPNLTNQDQYGLLIGNCCSSSEYQTTCFAEEIVRAANKGAVGYIGGSNSTYWDEDYYFGVGVGTISENPPPYEETTLGNYDRSFHDHGEEFSDWFTTMDQIIFAGNFAVSESGSSREEYYWDIYNLIGDPSLMIYYSMPEVNPVTHTQFILIGETSLTVNAAPYSYVALNHNGENIVSVLSDATGLAILEFPGFTSPGYAELVITAQNYQPHIENIQIFAPDGPFCIYENHTINDDSLGNGNNNADYDEQVFINLSMVNWGNDDAIDVDVTISSQCSDLIFLDNNDVYDTIQINQVVTHDNGFLIQIADDVEDQTNMIFEIVATDNNDSTWTSEFEIMANAPKLTPLELLVDDSQYGNDNGRLDAGETAIIKIKTANTGHCVAYDVTASLLAYNPYITILSGDSIIPVLSTFGSIYPEFEVEVSNNAPEGILAELRYQLSSGGYFVERTYYPKVGLILEDWETGNFNKFEWHDDGDMPWVINNAYPYEGYYDVVSGQIGNNKTSEFWISYQVMSPDSISFYKKVSSEADFDKLQFYIDNVLQDEWSGTSQSWTREAYAVSPGVRKFRWVYSKDYSQTGGADKAWIDYIELPIMMTTTVYAGPDQGVCENGLHQCLGSATNFDTIYWVTSGTGTFDDPQSLGAIYSPSEDDILAGNIKLSLNLIDVDGIPASDTMNLFVDYLPSNAILPTGPEQIDLQVTTQSDYETELVAGADSYNWIISPEESGVITGNSNTGTVIWNNQFEGEAWIKVAGVNSCGPGVYSDSLLVIVSNPVGIIDYGAFDISIIPNPNNGIFSLYISSDKKDNLEISLVNIQGKQVVRPWKLENTISNEYMMDLRSLNPGIYFIIVQNKESRSIKKLLIESN